MTKKQKLELTWIGKENRPKLGGNEVVRKCLEPRGELWRQIMAQILENGTLDNLAVRFGCS